MGWARPSSSRGHVVSQRGSGEGRVLLQRVYNYSPLSGNPGKAVKVPEACSLLLSTVDSKLCTPENGDTLEASP